MSDAADYDADILLWSERQAALLRDLKARVRGLPNGLDLENVAEEIESVGRSEQATVESCIELVLRHALKAASVRKPTLVAKWRSEAANFSQQARRRITPAMRRRIDLDDLWRDALEQAQASLAEHEDELAGDLPAAAPLPLDLLIARPLDFEAIVAAIKAARVETGAASVS